MLRCSKLLLIAVIPALIAAGCGKRTSATTTGGTRVVLRIKTNALPAGKTVKNTDFEPQLISTISKRAAGLSQSGEKPAVVVDKDRVVVTLPGLTALDKATANRAFTINARLGFYWIRDAKTDKNPAGKWEMMKDEDKDGNEIYSFVNSATNEILNGDTPEGRKKIMKQVVKAEKYVPGGVKPMLTGDQLKPESKESISRGKPVMLIHFTPEGTAIFRNFTRKHVGDVLAVISDGRILTAPTINEPIMRGDAEISGFTSLKEAKSFAEQLNAGTLPVPVTVESIDRY
ncbi:MAG: hypothetical protein ABFD64_09210 [Armatimonadota bacterium]